MIVESIIADATPGERGPEPVRMCIACRQRRPQTTLCRFHRRRDGEVVPSVGPRAGRGAYLCPTRSCYRQACKRRAWTHALRTSKGLSVQADPSNLWSSLLQSIDHELQRLGSHASIRARGSAGALRALHGRLHERGEDV